MGTVTTDLVKTVNEFQAGKVEFRNDKEGNVHFVIGKVGFDQKQLLDNFLEVYSQVNKLKPSKAKGVYLKSITICSTMSPGIKINHNKSSGRNQEMQTREEVIAQKQKTVETLVEKIKETDALFFADFRGLDVAQLQALRSELRDGEAVYKIVKNSLIQRAFNELSN